MKYDKIALCGRSGSGKDYICNKLKTHFQDYCVLSFSDGLKYITRKIFTWMQSDYPPESKEKPLNVKTPYNELITLSPREIWLKMNFLREIENNLFVRLLDDEYRYFLELGQDKFLISDLRTSVEYKWLKNNNFKIIKIENENSLHKTHKFDDELETFEYDGVYVNNYNKEFNLDEFLKILK